MSSAPPAETVAAVDLGSNSFHMVVARLVDGQLHTVDRLRERVALATGLDAERNLSSDACDRALKTLTLFGARLGHMPPGSVRTVGTNTLRQAKNTTAFLEQAEAALGHPIEIISGREEARLIYLGVAHGIEQDNVPRLVIDIGGGSTECIIGKGFETIVADSLYMGCVTYSSRFFADGQMTVQAFEEAELAAALELASIERRYRSIGWSKVLGASGTIVAVDSILRAHDWGRGGITRKGVRKLKKALIGAETTAGLTLPGMQLDRATVLPGGVAILLSLLERLDIDAMEATGGALREGLLWDLLGRIRQDDIRDVTIRRMTERFHVDDAQAERVEAAALALFDQVRDVWVTDGRDRRALAWAARLHEIGLAISYSGYHKHGAYLVANSDLPGFSRNDQQLLAAIILGHRRRLRLTRFDTLPNEQRQDALRLSLILRIAVRLNRNRDPLHVADVLFSARKRSLRLTFPTGWLDERPLMRADLEREAELLAPSGFELGFQ